MTTRNIVQNPKRMQVSIADLFDNIPSELKERKQWAVGAPDKAPWYLRDGIRLRASSTDPNTWMNFEKARACALQWDGSSIGYMLSSTDEFSCIDLDDKEGKTTEQNRAAFLKAIRMFDSYTEYSRSGRGFHIWVRGTVGRGRKKGCVELYDRERFIICTGNVYHNKAISDRSEKVAALAKSMGVSGSSVEGDPVNFDAAPNTQVIEWAQQHDRWTGKAWRGELPTATRDNVTTYQDPQIGDGSQSAADLLLVKILMRKTASDNECWATFRMSALGQRKKALRPDYARRTLNLAQDSIEQEATQALHGDALAQQLLGGMQSETGPQVDNNASLPDSLHPIVSPDGIMSNIDQNTPQGAQKKTSAATPAPRTLIGRSLGNVEMRAIDWLWQGWIPKGYITLLAGESGAGKTTILADIAARVSTGAPWPGDTEARQPARVLWLGSEDSIEEMTIPRLIACDADIANIVEIQGVTQNDKRGTFSMQDDLAAVGGWLTHANAEGKPFAMLVIDPVTSYLPGERLRKVDMNDAGQLRNILEPWLTFAQQHGIAIVCVTHFSKNTDRSMLHRVLGSAAFAQTCRSLCVVIDPPENSEGQAGVHDKVFMQVKTNLPDLPTGAWKFSTERVEVGTDRKSGRIIAATRPKWDEMDAALTPRTAIGGQRGPKQQGAFSQLAMMLRPFFHVRCEHEWIKSEDLIALFVDRKTFTAPSKTGPRTVELPGVSQKAWDTHSKAFLLKSNRDGIWMCRIKDEHRWEPPPS